MSIGPESLEALKVLCLGFAFAGLSGTAFELFADRPVSFRLLQAGHLGAVASVPLLVFCAPFIILRTALRRRRFERRSGSAVMLATVMAGLWSMPCGRLLLDATLHLLPA